MKSCKFYQDINGTIPAINKGDKVALLVDDSGNRFDLTQPDADKRPILLLSIPTALNPEEKQKITDYFMKQWGIS